MRRWWLVARAIVHRGIWGRHRWHDHGAACACGAVAVVDRNGDWLVYDAILTVLDGEPGFVRVTNCPAMRAIATHPDRVPSARLLR